MPGTLHGDTVGGVTWVGHDGCVNMVYLVTMLCVIW